MTLWAGGDMTRRVRKTLPGVVLIPDLASTIGALQDWRAQAAATVTNGVTHRAPAKPGGHACTHRVSPRLNWATRRRRW